MKKTLWVLMAFATISAAACAQDLMRFNCSTNAEFGKPEQHWHIAVDKQGSKVRFRRNKDAKPTETVASFSGDTVSWREQVIPSEYRVGTLNLTTLFFTEHLFEPGGNVVYTGKCNAKGD